MEAQMRTRATEGGNEATSNAGDKENDEEEEEKEEGEVMIGEGKDKKRVRMIKIRYGMSSPNQYVLLYTGDAGGSEGEGDEDETNGRGEDGKRRGIVVFIHGGFWKSLYGLQPMTAECGTIVASLLSHDYDVAMIEYRRDGDAEWGFPHTNIDVLTAYQYVLNHYENSSLPLGHPVNVALMGHSAGGTLALWLTAHLQQQQQQQQHYHQSSPPSPDGGGGSGGAHDDDQTAREPSQRDNAYEKGHDELRRPIHTYALAPVSNLSLAVALGLSDDGHAVQNYMHGTPEHIPHAYSQACPTLLAHYLTQSPITLMLGDNDDQIPSLIVSSCFDAIKSQKSHHLPIPNVSIDFIRLHHTDHFSIVHASSHAWTNIVQLLNSHFNQSSINFPPYNTS